MRAIWERLNLTDEGDDNFIQSKMLTRQVEFSQKRVEGTTTIHVSVLGYEADMREQRGNHLLTTSTNTKINHEKVTLYDSSYNPPQVVKVSHINRSKRLNLEGMTLLTTQSVSR